MALAAATIRSPPRLTGGGVNERGEKHFLAIEDGVRESTQSWREILLQLKARGMDAPKLAVVMEVSDTKFSWCHPILPLSDGCVDEL